MIKFTSILKVFANIIALSSFFGVLVITLVIAMIEPYYGAYPVLKVVLLAILGASSLYLGLSRGRNKKHLKAERR